MIVELQCSNINILKYKYTLKSLPIFETGCYRLQDI